MAKRLVLGMAVFFAACHPSRHAVPTEINVRDYGAKADGKADDTAAIQAAIDALPSSGGSVYFPCGSYRISNGLTTRTKGSFVLHGGGTGGWGNSSNQCSRIVSNQSITMLSLGTGTNQLTGGRVERMTFVDDSGNHTVRVGVYVSDSFTVIDHCDFQSMATAALYDGGNYYQNANRFRDNQVRNVHIGVDVMGYGDGPITSGNYIVTDLGTANNVGIRMGGTGGAIKSVADNLVVGSSASPIGIQILSSDNAVHGTKVEMQPGCCVGTAVSIGAGSARNTLDYGVSKAINALVLEPGAVSVGGTIAPGNTTHIDPIDNSGGTAYVNMRVVGTVASYIVGTGGVRYLSGTAYPAANLCTAGTLGSLYSRNQGSSGLLYLCSSAGTWVAK